jgi:hypothetical protein
VSSQFKAILDTALSEYKKKTGNDLLSSPLAKELQSCESSEAVLVIIQREAQAFDKFRDGDKGLMKWIDPSVDVLFTISSTVGAGVSIVCTTRYTTRYDLSGRVITSLCSRFLLQVLSLPGSGFSSLFVPLRYLSSNLLTPAFFRQQGMSGRATVYSSTCLSASNSSLSVLGFTLEFRRPRKWWIY